MIRGWVLAATIFLCSVSVYALTKISYERGYATAQKMQADLDRAAYATILEKINANKLDPSDDAAILRELCRMAGYKPSDPQCSGL